MKEDIRNRLNVTHEWAQRHAKRSTQPSRFLDYYEGTLGVARTRGDMPETLIDFSDPLQLAAEIEALAAWRRVQRWHTGEGLLKSRTFPVD
jgi:hypothetical protein